MPRLSGYSPEATRTALTLAALGLVKQRRAIAEQQQREAFEATQIRREMPASPNELATLVAPTKWNPDLPHTALMNQALVYLEQRLAPVWWLRKYIREQRPGSRELVPMACEGYEDDDWHPFTRLVIQAPPRHGKSELISSFGTAWYLGRHPDHHVMLASYSSAMVSRWSRRAREIIRSWGPAKFGFGLGSVQTTAEWTVAGGDGGLYASGIRGPMTGRGANALFIDDPFKDAKEANSETVSEGNWDWFRSVANTRLEVDDAGLPPIICITMARWSEGDLVGRVLEQDADSDDPEDHFVVLNLPAIAEEDDVLGREVGEALWPARYDVERLKRLQLRIGSYYFGALYQGRPTPLGGGLFPRELWQRYTTLPPKARTGGIFIDTATDDKATGDPFAMATIRVSGLDFYWTNVVNKQLSFPAQVQAVLDAREASKLGPNDAGLPVYIEETPWAKPLIRTLRKLITRVIGVPPEGSKLARAMAVTPYHEGLNCYLPLRADWVADFIEQHSAFPSPGWHDDMVDTTSLGLFKLGTRALMPGNEPMAAAVEYVPDEPAGRTPTAKAAAVRKVQEAQQRRDDRADRRDARRRLQPARDTGQKRRGHV